jgi:hypothetical protein
MEQERSRFRDFIRAFWPNWFAMMSGGPSVPAAIIAYYVDNPWAKVALWATAFGCLILAAYLVWRAERQKAMRLAEQVTPKFKLSFDQEKRGIVPAVLVIPWVGATTTRASYIRICVTATSARIVKDCHGFIVMLEKRMSENETFLHVPLPQSVPLVREKFEVVPRIPSHIDFMIAAENGKFMPVPGVIPWPNVVQNAFDDHATYRFTIVVNGDGVSEEPICVEIDWRGQWDKIVARQIIRESAECQPVNSSASKRLARIRDFLHVS